MFVTDWSPRPFPVYQSHMMTAPSPLDPLGNLTGLIREGDERAFRVLFDALYDPLLRFARSSVGDTAAAEDLVQEAFVRVWDRRATLDTTQPIRAYLYRTVRNLALNRLRDHRTRERLLNDATITDTAAVPRPMIAPDDRLAGREMGAELTRLVDALPPRQREALTLSRLQGLSHDEVAQVMGCAPRTVNNHLVAALAFLRRELTGAVVAALAWILI